MPKESMASDLYSFSAVPQLCLNLMRNSCKSSTNSRTRPRNRPSPHPSLHTPCYNRHRLPRLALPIELGRDLGQVGQHLLVQGRHRSVRILRHHLEDLLDDVRLTAGMNEDKSLQHNAVQLNSNCTTQRAFVLPFTSFWERKKALRSWTFFSLASRAS